MTFVKTKVLNPLDREILSTNKYSSLIEFLIEKYPNGFIIPTDIYIQNIKIEVAQYDIKLKENDIIILIERPALPVGIVGGVIATFFANLAIAVTIQFVMGKLFEPSTPDMGGSQNNTASSVYNLNASQNEAKAGQAIPVIYGTVRSYPAMINPPYYRYEENQEYLYHLLCIGQGQYSIDQLLIDNQDVIDHEDVTWKKLTQTNFHDIESASGDDNYVQTVSTLSTPSSLELIGGPASNYDVGFESSGNKITLYGTSVSSIIAGSTITIYDSLYNNGTYVVNSVSVSSGHTYLVVNESVTNEPNNYFQDLSIHDGYSWIEEYDGFYEKSPLYHNFNIGDYFRSANVIFKITNQYHDNSVEPSTFNTVTDKMGSGTVTTIEYVTTPCSISVVTETSKYEIRETIEEIEIDYVYPGGVYALEDNGDYKEFESSFYIRIWAGTIDNLVLNYKITITEKTNEAIRKSERINIKQYGDNIWISFVKLTSDNVSNKVQDKLFIHRVKELLVQGDNTDYGNITLLWLKIKATNAISSSGQMQVNGYFTRTDVANDMKSVLEDIYTNSTYGGRLSSDSLDFEDTSGVNVNGAFDKNMTIYDAMKMVAKSQKYHLYPVGQDLVLKYDDKKTITTALYNETNILEDSLKIQYFFKEESVDIDGYECKYIEADGWIEEFVRYPTDSLYPAKLDLFGVTEKSVAERMVKYYYNQDKYRRTVVSFSTDIQGLVPQFLDKILISHNTLNWGNAGEVVSINENKIELSDSVADVTILQITFRNIDGSVSETFDFSKIDDFNVTISGNIPTWVTVGTFYTTGEVREYLVLSVKPNGNRVSIECSNYDEKVYE